ncbi:MAG: type II toxin-antitoxin system RelE/ParE family toxin, partial [Methanosarcinales archaeon]
MRVEFGSKAFKFLSKMDEVNKKKVFNKIKKLEENPFPKGFKKLKGEKDAFRIKVGAFRILYKIIKEDKVILIFKI